MRLKSISYFFREAFGGLFKNSLMTIASIAAVTACILIVTFSYSVIANLDSVLSQIEDGVEIVVFLNKDAQTTEIQDINDKLLAINHVKNVKYIPPDEALDGLKQEWGSKEILDGFKGDRNPLSSSFKISVDSIENQASVLEELKAIEGIKKTSNAASETEFLININKGVKFGGAIVILILAIISVVIIINTIKISLFIRRKEIGIMKLIGATDWFIRWPFIIEGIIIGLIGSTIPLVIFYFGYVKIVNIIYESLPIIKNVVTFSDVTKIFAFILPYALGGGITLGVLGSIMSLRKYLRV